MPAMIPENVLREAATPEIRHAVEHGWDLQIRGRVREHLEWFIENYMEPGSCSVVYESRNKDYNVRAYTDREAFGEGLKAASLAMDYVKFKDTAKQFTWGKKYYDLLLRVWSASTALAAPYSGESPDPHYSFFGYETRFPAKRGKNRGKNRRGNPRNRFSLEDYRQDLDGPYGDDRHGSVRIHDMTDDEFLRYGDTY